MQMKTMLKYSPAVPALDEALAQHAFPKKIFQTWNDSTVPAGMYDAMQSWIQHNPDWEYHFLNHTDRRAFIVTHFSSDVVRAYDQLLPGAYRADLWRYCVLYIHGGLYADSKLVCHQSLNQVLSADVDVDLVVVRDVMMKRREFPGYLWQAFMVAKPGLALFKMAIDRIVQHVAAGYYGCDNLSITGPGLLGKMLNLSLAKAACDEIQVGQHRADGFVVDVMPIPDFSQHTVCRLYRYPACITSYVGYRSDRLNSEMISVDLLVRDYVACWFLGKVYRHGQVVRDHRYSYFRKRVAPFWLNYVKAAYSEGAVGVARQRLVQAFKEKGFSIKLFFVWLRYDLLRIR